MKEMEIGTFISNETIILVERLGINLVNTLNSIASQYTNSKYIVNSRHTGYDTQNENCTNYNTKNCPSQTYSSIDEQLINSAIGTMEIVSPDGENTRYFLSGGVNWKDLRYLLIPNSSTNGGITALYTYQCTGAEKSFSMISSSLRTEVNFSGALSTYYGRVRLNETALFASCASSLDVGAFIRPLVTFGSSCEISCGS